MAKKIVTHINPDLDAVTAIWLLLRFGGRDFADVTLAFVPAGERLGDENDTVHVDTGLGKFDHHQEDRGREDTSAALLVYEWLVATRKIKEQEELRRLIIQVKDIDHFREYSWPQATDDRYELMLHHVLNGMKMGGLLKSDDALVREGMRMLDGVYTAFKIRLSAEAELHKGISFTSRWGKALAVLSQNSGITKLALMSGYRIVARKDPEIGMVRIKSAPLEEIDLAPLHKLLKERDPGATWYFHPSGHMVLNGSTRNPEMRPSRLGLDEVIEILKSV